MIASVLLATGEALGAVTEHVARMSLLLAVLADDDVEQINWPSMENPLADAEVVRPGGATMPLESWLERYGERMRAEVN